MKSQIHRLVQSPRFDKIFLRLLASVYVIYLVAFGSFLYPAVLAPSETITEHQVDTNPNVIVQHWTVASMRNAISTDQPNENATDLTQGNIDTSKSRAAQQEGQPPRNGESSYPLSTV